MVAAPTVEPRAEALASPAPRAARLLARERVRRSSADFAVRAMAAAAPKKVVA